MDQVNASRVLAIRQRRPDVDAVDRVVQTDMEELSGALRGDVNVGTVRHRSNRPPLRDPIA